MATLVDTCVLLRAFDAKFSGCRGIRQALRKALEDKEPLFVTVQNMAEFWNVATRPLEHNGHRIHGHLKAISCGMAKFCGKIVIWLNRYKQ